jgi:DNA-directed RNA polymerase specialized sigma24 family protein
MVRAPETCAVERILLALMRMRGQDEPITGSVIHVEPQTGRRRDGFRPAFVMGMDERTDLVHRFRALEPRERMLLFLWYVEGRPVTEVASRLGISRVHCYRLRAKALQTLAEAAPLPAAG